MTPLFRLALITVAASAVSAAAMAQPQTRLDPKVWTQTQSDVKPDPAVRFGQLANGLRYAILKNDTPAHQTALRLRIGSGSLEERDDQQGLAHFLEHMAFKGSTHVPEGEMIKLLERHGLAFGPDTNAQTGFTETVFMLDLPESDPQTLDLGLMLMRETASELTLSQSAMNPERGVVLSEERLRDTPDYEAMKARMAFQLPGQLEPRRLPIGQVDILKAAPVSLIRQYYAANYRPDRATLIVVGDIDPDKIEAEIKAKFASWTPVGPETAEPDYGKVATRGPATQLIVQPGARGLIDIEWVKPFEDTPESEAKDRRLQVEQVALAVLNRRLERAAQGEAPPFIGASASVGDESNSARETSLYVLPKAGAWRAALTAALAIQRQATDYGVTQAEVDREITALHTTLQEGAEGAATRRTPDLAQELVRTVDEGEVFTSPAQDLTRFDRNTKGLSATAVSAALKAAFMGQGPALSFTSPDPVEGGEAAVAAAFAAARTGQLAAAPAETGKAWPYARFGPAGTVVGRRDVTDLGVTFVTFANGVRLTVKPTAFRKDQVLVNVRLGEGRLALPKDRQTEIWAAPAFHLGGLGKISYEDMERVLTGKSYSVALNLTDDAFVLGGQTRPADLGVQMQVLAAYVSDPGFAPSAFERARNFYASQLPQMNATPQGVLGRDLGLLTHAGDQRWATPTAADLDAATPGAFKALLSPVLSSAPLEVVVVGDVTVDAAIRAVAATFAALPARPAPRAPTPAELAVGFPATGAAPIDLTHKGRNDQAEAIQVWPTDGLLVDPQKARTITVASEVLELRLLARVRIAEGSTYSPSVSAAPSETFPTRGVVTAEVETPPARIPGFYTALREIAADLRTKGPTADEMDRAVKPHMEAITKAQQTNEYWMTWVSGADRDPRRLDIVRSTLPGYRRITPTEVQAVAARYLTDANAWRLVVTPQAAPSPAPLSASGGQ